MKNTIYYSLYVYKKGLKAYNRNSKRFLFSIKSDYKLIIIISLNLLLIEEINYIDN